MSEPLVAPFPWFGGKRRVAPQVWQRFGDVGNYIEPFLGSGAVLLGRPGGAGPIETTNDADGLLCNAWRGIQQAPEAMAEHACYLAHECDLHARHAFLVEQREDLTRKLEGNPEYCDVKLAGWWLWGIASWIGGGWCAGVGPWHRTETEDGCQRLHLGSAGRGVQRQRLHLRGAGQGVQRQRLHLGGGEGISGYMEALATRLRRVRVCCGDWQRVCGPTPTFIQGLTGVFLDPPYSAEALRDPSCYAVDDDAVAHRVRAWCVENGSNPLLRIALCGYDGEGHEELTARGWKTLWWKAHGGYGCQGDGAGRDNAARECIWFSPACLGGAQAGLFDDGPEGPAGAGDDLPG